MALEMDATASEIIRRQQNAKAARGTWEGLWEDIAARVVPSYRNTFNSNGITSPGQDKTIEMVDATAALALPKFAAAMESMLTPRGSIWHRLVAGDPVLNRNRQVRAYLDDVNDRLFRYRYAPQANFASQQHEVYMALGAFGTGVKFIDRLRGPGARGLRYRAIHLGEIFIAENHQGIVDTVFRRFPMTARQALQRFKDSKPGLPEEIVSTATDGGRCENTFWFIHAVYPREDYDPGRLDAKGMQYADVYVSETGRKTVEENGFHTFPYTVSRYVQAPGETYGRSPAMLALPAIKTLNEQKRTVLTQGHRVVNPTFLVHDDGVADAATLKPGGIWPGAVTSDGKKLVDIVPTGNLAVSEKLMGLEIATINDAFLITLFQILAEDRPQMTATEVIERAREKGALLSPSMGRQQTEDSGPSIERELDVLSAQGLLPPMPLVLQQAGRENGNHYRVQYDSPLSRAQRAENASGFMRLVDWVKEYYAVSQDPRPFDFLNWDKAMPDLADIAAVPTSWVNDLPDVEAIRQQRSQAQAQQQAVEAAPALAAVAKSAPSMVAGVTAGA